MPLPPGVDEQGSPRLSSAPRPRGLVRGLLRDLGIRSSQPTDRARCLGSATLALPPLVSVSPIDTFVPIAMRPRLSSVSLL